MTYKKISALYLARYAALALAIFLTACGGNDSSEKHSNSVDSNDEVSTIVDTDEPSGTENPSAAYAISISFIKGPVMDAQCALFQSANGEKGLLLNTGETDENGIIHYDDSVSYQGLALIECVGGYYVDEALEQLTVEQTPLMRSVVNIHGEAGSQLHFIVSPLTEVAASLALKHESGLASAITGPHYNQQVAIAFGLNDDVNITSVMPLDLLKSIETTESNEADYAFAIALFSSMAALDVSSNTLDDIIKILTNDLSLQFAEDNGLFSQEVRAKLGDSAAYFLKFGSRINSALQATSVRQNIVNRAELILPEIGTGKTDSLNEPLSTIQAELVQFILDNQLKALPEAPKVSNAMYNLGQALAFDKILSGNQDTSCLTCHHPLLASGDARALSLGAGGEGLGQSRSGGQVIARHAPPLFNLDLFKNLFWDGRIQLTPEGKLSTPADATGDLSQEMSDVFFAQPERDGFQGYGLVAAQALFPVTDTLEMRGEAQENNELAKFAEDDFAGIWAALMTRLGNIPEYIDLFEAAYPNTDFKDMTFAHAANAIAGFEIAAFNLRDNPWQQFITDVAADGHLDNPERFDEQTTRGAHFFFDTGCINCHKGAVMSDFDFHSIANVQFGPGKGNGESGFEDWGRELQTGNTTDRAKFRTAPLFNVELSAPYGHLGQFSDLWSHIQIYAIPERFWLNLYTGYDRIVGDFVHTPDFENHISDSEKALFKTFPVPSYDNNPYGFFRTLDFIETQLERAENDPGRLTEEEGKRLGDGELGSQRRILLPFMEAQTDPAARDLSHLIPSSVPSGLPVESSLTP